jgi:hypothetical protein
VSNNIEKTPNIATDHKEKHHRRHFCKRLTERFDCECFPGHPDSLQKSLTDWLDRFSPGATPPV